MGENKIILKIENLSKQFGGLRAIDGLDMHVFENEILGIIGPNGAGKTTLYNVISGTFRPTSGKVIFKNENLTGLKTHQVARKGIARTFQANSLFREETVRDNVIFAFHIQRKAGSFGWFFNSNKAREQEKGIREQADQIVDYMGLNDLKDELAKNLAHGDQRVLGVAMALATNPAVLLLDEPLTGMNPTEKTEMVTIINGLREQRGITLVVIEHDMSAIMSLCDRITVLNYGQKIAEGLPEEVKTNKEVISAYLGGAEEIS